MEDNTQNVEQAISDDAKDFNPIAFTEEMFNSNTEESNDASSESDSDTEASTEVDTQANTEASTTDDWDFEEPGTETQNTQEAPAAEEAPKNAVNGNEVDWGGIAKELGLEEAVTKEDIIAKLQEKSQPAPVENTGRWDELLGMSDRDLVNEQLKLEGYSEDEAEDYLDRLLDNGELKHRARSLRNSIKREKENEAKEAKRQAEIDKETRAKKVEENKKALQETIKSRTDFEGYQLSREDKQKVYSYITGGDFYKELSNSHEAVFELAMYKLFKEPMLKLQSNRGYEDGKSQILDNITSPDLGRTSKPRPAPGAGFDPKRFVNE